MLTDKSIDDLAERYKSEYKKLLTAEAIPLSKDNIELLSKLYIPLSYWLSLKKEKPFTLGINGAQGSGKTTFTKILKLLLNHIYKKSVVSFSIDDLYLTQQERLKLSKSQHPLLATRGVPGTHDITLGLDIFQQLKGDNKSPTYIPTFNKAIDDRNNQHNWQKILIKPDIILFEGWCVGAQAETDQSLNKAINLLEEKEDINMHWRKYINDQLKDTYTTLFSEIDELIMLKIPDFQKVIEWRKLQETKLKNSSGQYAGMNEQEIERFTMHFERITRNCLKEMPTRATLVFEIGMEHCINNALYNK